MKWPFSKNKKIETSIYLILLLREDSGLALIIKKENHQSTILGKKEFNYTGDWQNIVESADEAIFFLEKNLNVEVKETIFYLYSHLLDEKTKEVKGVYLSKIKKLVKALSLKALGYIGCYNAVALRIQKKEGLPLTAIIIEFDKTGIAIFIYKGGRLVFNKAVAKTSNIVDDFLNAVDEVKGSTLLPARIILYDSTILDKQASELITHNWKEDFFIQIPRVKVIQQEELISGLKETFINQLEDYSNDKGESEYQETEKISHEVMGFKIGEDVGQKIDNVEEQTPRYKKIDKERKSSLIPFLKDYSNRIVLWFKKIFFNFKEQRKNQNRLIFIGILLILSGLFLNEFFLHKAEIIVYLPSKSIEKSFNLDSIEFPLIKKSSIKEVSKSKSTTGKKDVGEKAKGEVVVYNFSNNVKTFASDTVIQNNGLKFIFDDKVKIASASNTTINGNIVKKPGKAKVGVTASEIGPSYNLIKNKEFSVGDLPRDTYFAVNKASFSGGSKKTVRTVSKSDIINLEEDALKEAKKNKNNSSSQKKGDEIINGLTESKITKKIFSKEVGERSDELSLKAKVEKITYSYKKNNLIDFVSPKLKNDLGDKKFVIKPEKISFIFDNFKRENDKLFFDLSVKAVAIKEVPSENVKRALLGKNKQKIEEELKKMFNITGFKINSFKEPIFILNNYMPFFKKNINLIFSSL